MWYRYGQNNSGGSFIHDTENGVGYSTWIEANSSTEADEKARDLGIYFNGVELGNDCGCCGDRWTSMNNYWSEDKADGWSKYDKAPVPSDKLEWNIHSYAHPLEGERYLTSAYGE